MDANRYTQEERQLKARYQNEMDAEERKNRILIQEEVKRIDTILANQHGAQKAAWEREFQSKMEREVDEEKKRLEKKYVHETEEAKMQRETSLTQELATLRSNSHRAWEREQEEMEKEHQREVDVMKKKVSKQLQQENITNKKEMEELLTRELGDEKRRLTQDLLARRKEELSAYRNHLLEQHTEWRSQLENAHRTELERSKFDLHTVLQNDLEQCVGEAQQRWDRVKKEQLLSLKSEITRRKTDALRIIEQEITACQSNEDGRVDDAMRECVEEWQSDLSNLERYVFVAFAVGDCCLCFFCLIPGIMFCFVFFALFELAKQNGALGLPSSPSTRRKRTFAEEGSW